MGLNYSIYAFGEVIVKLKNDSILSKQVNFVIVHV